MTALLRVSRRVASILTRCDLAILIALYGLFVLTDRLPLPGLLAICLLWIARWWTTRRFARMTPMTLPILSVLIMVPVTLYASADWTLSLPKIYGTVLSIAVFYTVVNRVHTLQGVWLVTFGLVLASSAVALLGLAGTDWSQSKLFALPQLYERLPRLIQGIPRSIQGGFSANGVGGTLIFFIPLLVSLLCASPELPPPRFLDDDWRLRIWWRWHRPIVLLSLLLAVLALVLTKSRGSYVGLAVGLWALAVWRDRRWLWLIPGVALALVVITLTGRVESLMELVLRMDTVAGNVSGTMQGRFEVWQRALYMIQDFPYTGIGMGTFDRVVHVLYPLFLIGPDAQVTHAHNELLQVAVDMGIPTLVAYVALLSAFAMAAWRAYRTLPDPGMRAVIVGLACGMLAHQVFGVTDAFLLGTKPGVVMWVFLGIVAGLYLHRHGMTSEGRVSKEDGEAGTVESSIRSRIGDFLLAFGYWILFSLLAIAFVGNRPTIGLAIALAGGLALGFFSLMPLERRTYRGRRQQQPRRTR